MIMLSLAAFGFALAWYTPLRVSLIVGCAMFCVLVVGFLAFAQDEVPSLSPTINAIDFYTSAVVTGASSFLVFGLAVLVTGTVMASYIVGVFAGRMALKWRSRTT
ncbi:MAG: hypothetical protein ACSHWY_02820 [Octadecabacter sp.]